MFVVGTVTNHSFGQPRYNGSIPRKTRDYLIFAFGTAQPPDLWVPKIVTLEVTSTYCQV
jgi:hypothetical protein